MNEEAQYGGLIDKYFFLNWILIPCIIIFVIILSIKLLFNCPYVEDVSSCFPYNMPSWFPWICLFLLIIIPIIIIFLIKKQNITNLIPNTQNNQIGESN